MLLPEYLLTATLAMIVHMLVNQKYVATALVVLAPVARDAVRRLRGDDNLLLSGSRPAWMHSEIAGFGPGIEARLWFTLYFGGWALLFALVTYLLWVQAMRTACGRDSRWRDGRLTRPPALVGATALAIIIGAGGFIFYNTHILNDSMRPARRLPWFAYSEERHGIRAPVRLVRITPSAGSRRDDPTMKATRIIDSSASHAEVPANA